MKEKLKKGNKICIFILETKVNKERNGMEWNVKILLWLRCGNERK